MPARGRFFKPTFKGSFVAGSKILKPKKFDVGHPQGADIILLDLHALSVVSLLYPCTAQPGCSQ